FPRETRQNCPNIDAYALLLIGDLEEGRAQSTERTRAATRRYDPRRQERPQAVRRPLPDHLPRERVEHPARLCLPCLWEHASDQSRYRRARGSGVRAVALQSYSPSTP